MNRQEKQAVVDEMTEKLRSAQLVVLTDYTGLSVEHMNKFRRQLDSAADTEFCVLKNTLCSRAIEGTAMEGLRDYLTGPTAVLIGLKDPVSPAKVLSTFTKENEKLKVKAGFFGGKVISQEEIKALASLPSREVLLGQLLGTLQAPLSQFVGVLAAVPQQFLGVLNAYQDKLEKGE